MLEEFGCARMPRNAQTRWNFSSRVVNTVASNYDRLIETFNRIVEHPSMDDETACFADGLKTKSEDFDFMFLLFTFEVLFSHTDVLFDILQHKSMDVSFCMRRIDHLMKVLDELKLERAFDNIYNRVAMLTEDPELAHRRKRRQGQQDQYQVYKALYDSIHNSIRAQITQRFQHLSRLQFMELLNRENFDSFKLQFPMQALANLSETYGHFFDEVKLKTELQHFYADPELHSSQQLYDGISFMKSSGLNEAMPQLYRLRCLIATIGVTSAGVECSFSCLKRIKTYTRNTIGQDLQI